MTRIAILGSTGSIGKSTLEIVRRHSDRFEIAALVANRNTDLLAAQVAEFRPATAVLCDETLELPTDPTGRTEWSQGIEAMLAAACDPEVDVVVNAVVGAAGLRPTLVALQAGHRVALANKE